MRPFRTIARESPWRLVALVTTLIAIGAVRSTYGVFNNLYDEPAHIAAGMEWLARGSYTYEPQHPPLSRIAAAIGPWLAGERGTGYSHMYTEGRFILGRGEHYERMLAFARLGQLPFFLMLVATTWAWGRRVGDERVAALATVFVAANPNILAHAGIAGTDIGPAALMPAALLAWMAWLEQPSRARSVVLGLAVALCGLTKFSALAFWLPAAIVLALVAVRTAGHAADPAAAALTRSARRRAVPLGIAASVAAIVTWAVYRFSVGPVGELTLPAPALWVGLRDFFRHGTGGHPAYLFGEVRSGGWWYYDLVAFLVKTPLPLLIAGVGAALVLRSRERGDTTADDARAVHPPQRPYAIALVVGIGAILLVACLTPVDIGIRLLLPVYPLVAVLAALTVAGVWSRYRAIPARAAAAALVLWTLAEPVTAHPDHIAYFNELAGSRPERILVDSNLDWGQDLYRLRDAARELRMDSLRVHYFGTAEFAAVGLERTRRLRPHERVTGWVAASETFYAGVWADTALHWLRAYEPVARVGRSIRLYFIK